MEKFRLNQTQIVTNQLMRENGNYCVHIICIPEFNNTYCV